MVTTRSYRRGHSCTVVDPAKFANSASDLDAEDLSCSNSNCNRDVSVSHEISVDSDVSSEAPSDGDPNLTSSNVDAISENGHRSSEATTNISSPLTSSSQGGSVGNGDDRSEAAMRADRYILSSDGPTQHINGLSSYNDGLTDRNVDEKCEGDKSVDRDVSLFEDAPVFAIDRYPRDVRVNAYSKLKYLVNILHILDETLEYDTLMRPGAAIFARRVETSYSPHKNFTIKHILKLLKSDRQILGWLPMVEIVKNLDFFLSYMSGRHSFERTLRMVKVGKKVRNQSDITKKLKQRSLVMHEFLVRDIDILLKLKTFHTDNILAFENTDESSCDPFYTTPFGQKEFSYARLEGTPQNSRLNTLYAIDVYEEFISKVVLN
ncbi:hypothetical protein; 77988-74922 [Arabidopsis thaliana]|uniref:Uncharacterized protein F15C21.12 n=1 Tax=Arabidopsis thaliana TaxID=3702 RepID=Q9C8F8_ARATH|nr:uncharacterized protein AT1G36230 [Arabidopsis thaliana]AAG51253.1 hypothetical protein; 77988-74922 [Arabidopsis thaliana]AEE31853.1 hypothetical protein AT1G36230 [Arabidopsis thaliana]|eukprot:NP_174852.1 hypothetical protein AT1G36230 [Arabidopsis thaliana]